jgi:hypothetical protein
MRGLLLGLVGRVGDDIGFSLFCLMALMRKPGL